MKNVVSATKFSWAIDSNKDGKIQGKEEVELAALGDQYLEGSKLDGIYSRSKEGPFGGFFSQWQPCCSGSLEIGEGDMVLPVKGPEVVVAINPTTGQVDTDNLVYLTSSSG